ncbi:hypothetical protein ZWY2020_041035 [Hordeum vulgare]|nr:hypothetical protein ZWY2020_041035 [Hordeum vulgare]
MATALRPNHLPTTRGAASMLLRYRDLAATSVRLLPKPGCIDEQHTDRLVTWTSLDMRVNFHDCLHWMVGWPTPEQTQPRADGHATLPDWK